MLVLRMVVLSVDSMGWNSQQHFPTACLSDKVTATMWVDEMVGWTVVLLVDRMDGVMVGRKEDAMVG